MGFNRRKMEDQRRQASEKEAAARRATNVQVLEDAERLITAWNERRVSYGRQSDQAALGNRCMDRSVLQIRRSVGEDPVLRCARPAPADLTSAGSSARPQPES